MSYGRRENSKYELKIQPLCEFVLLNVLDRFLVLRARKTQVATLQLFYFCLMLEKLLY